jgi:hypothetical protein
MFRMRLLLAVLLSAAIGAQSWPSRASSPPAYPYRWVFVSRNLQSDTDVDDIRRIARTAALHGLNGLVLSGGLDALQLQKPAFFARLAQVKAICDQYRLELIAMVLSVGYGSAALAFDRNLAEGIPVNNALFVVGKSQGVLQPDPPVNFVNPGLEDYSGSNNTEKGWNWHDQPGVVSFVDTAVFEEGKASLRFENFTANPYGHGRLMQEVSVHPQRAYRVTCFVRTEALDPPDSFALQVLATDGRALSPQSFALPATTVATSAGNGGWRKLTLGFNSLSYAKVRIYGGVWGARGGKFWLDDFHIEEVGLTNILRRSGTPVSVRSETSGLLYQEGVDYAAITDPKLNFLFDHDGPDIAILPASRIRDGDRLRVDYYHGMSINGGQVTLCMSEPALYQIWAEQMRRLHDILTPKKYFLSMDEIRAGGSDLACKQRSLTMGQILGDCFTRQVALIRAVNPAAEIFTWPDMLDPNHNAHADYYLVDGDFTNSWNYVPPDLRMVCWRYATRLESLGFFSRLGFRTLAAAYYDTGSLDNPAAWLESLAATPGAEGIMYTTWRNDYTLLGPFGDLVTARPGPPPVRH